MRRRLARPNPRARWHPPMAYRPMEPLDTAQVQRILDEALDEWGGDRGPELGAEEAAARREAEAFEEALKWTAYVPAES